MPSKASNRTSRGVSRGIHFIAATLALTGVSFYEQACAYTIDQRFPHLGGYKISSPHDYDDPDVQTQLARLDFLILEFTYGWGGSGAKGGAVKRKAVQAIKAKNPNIVIVDYCLLGEVHNTYAGQKPLRDKLEAHKWWLYQNGAGGSKVLSKGGTSIPNITGFVPADANGKRWNTWLPDYHFEQVWQYIPELDGTFTDAFFWKPRWVGDWNRDGKADSPNDRTVGRWWREGMMVHANRMKTLMPGKLVMGNLGPSGTPDAVNDEFDRQVHGGVLERFIGETWSAEKAGWKTMMNRYRKVMSILAEPRIMAFNVKGDPGDLKAFRYAFASALMDDGYFDFSDKTSGNIYSPKNVPWFDEYDLAGTANTKWLGTAVDGPPPLDEPWQDGVYRRRFQNGVVLVNPRGNGDQTVEIGSGYRRFLGKQDRVVNNGQTATSITLKDRDGIFLVKN